MSFGDGCTLRPGAGVGRVPPSLPGSGWGDAGAHVPCDAPSSMAQVPLGQSPSLAHGARVAGERQSWRGWRGVHAAMPASAIARAADAERSFIARYL